MIFAIKISHRFVTPMNEPRNLYALIFSPQFSFMTFKIRSNTTNELFHLSLNGGRFYIFGSFIISSSFV